MLKYLTLFAIVAISLSSCKSDPAGPASVVYVQPKLGSVFTFDEYRADSITGLPVPGHRDTSVQTVLQTGIPWMGKTNVMKVVTIAGKTNDTSYINFETNNDISTLYDANKGQWITFPISSKITNSIVLSDTIETGHGVSRETKITLAASYVDNETMVVKGQSINVIKIQKLATQTITTSGVSTIDSLLTFGYFAPSLGYTSKIDQPISTDRFGTKAEGLLSTLIDFNLK